MYEYISIHIHYPIKDQGEGIKESFYDKLERLFEEFSSYDIIIALGDSNVEIGKEEILRPTLGLESPHGECKADGVRVINFAIQKTW